MPVSLLWTVFCPRRTNGNRTVITRSERRLTFMEVDAAGQAWNISPRSRQPGREALEKDFRWSMTLPAPTEPLQAEEALREATRQWKIRISEMTPLNRAAVVCAVKRANYRVSLSGLTGARLMRSFAGMRSDFHECLRCGNRWMGRSSFKGDAGAPKRCALCRSPLWNKKRSYGLWKKPPAAAAADRISRGVMRGQVKRRPKSRRELWQKKGRPI